MEDCVETRLLQEQSTRAGGYTSNFAYDGAGNPTTFKGVPRVYNADNQDAANLYDGNGNPATYLGSPLTFDPKNRLTSVGAVVLTAGYTGEGLRAWKQTAAGRTYFLYDGWTPVCELSSTGSVTATHSTGANGLLSRRSGGASVFYTFDPQGSVAQRLDGAGNVLTSHVFDAWGVGQSSGATSEPWGYCAQWGYYTDRETGLLLLTYRYYDPGTGRFLTRDPIGYDGGINLYVYVGNSPANRIDPEGTFPGVMPLGLNPALLISIPGPWLIGLAIIVLVVWVVWSVGGWICSNPPPRRPTPTYRPTGTPGNRGPRSGPPPPWNPPTSPPGPTLGDIAPTPPYPGMPDPIKRSGSNIGDDYTPGPGDPHHVPGY